MVEAQLQYQGTVDASRIPAPEFLIGSRAYVKVQFFHTTHLSKKLADKFLGPYEVIAQLGTHSVTLRFQIASVPSTQCSMSQCWNLQP